MRVELSSWLAKRSSQHRASVLADIIHRWEHLR